MAHEVEEGEFEPENAFGPDAQVLENEPQARLPVSIGKLEGCGRE